jgi:hypothetical protein
LMRRTDQRARPALEGTGQRSGGPAGLVRRSLEPQSAVSRGG